MAIRIFSLVIFRFPTLVQLWGIVKVFYLLFHLSIACDGLLPIDCLLHLQLTFHWPLCLEISTLSASHAGQALRRLPCALGSSERIREVIGYFLFFPASTNLRYCATVTVLPMSDFSQPPFIGHLKPKTAACFLVNPWYPHVEASCSSFEVSVTISCGNFKVKTRSFCSVSIAARNSSLISSSVISQWST